MTARILSPNCFMLLNLTRTIKKELYHLKKINTRYLTIWFIFDFFVVKSSIQNHPSNETNKTDGQEMPRKKNLQKKRPNEMTMRLVER